MSMRTIEPSDMIVREATPEAKYNVDRLAVLGAVAQQMSHVTNLDDLISCCLRAIEQILNPGTIQVVWGTGASRRLLTPKHVLILQPAQPVLEALQQGQQAIEQESQSLTVWAPLTSRGILSGWIMLAELSDWGGSDAAYITSLAGHTAAALAMYDAVSRQDERLTQLQTLMTIGQQLSGLLDLDELLTAIHKAVQRVVDADTFYIARYEPTQATMEMLYFAVDGERRHLMESWPSGVGLAGVVLRERTPILTDDYAAECARRGVQAIPPSGVSVEIAWVGIPLIANDRAVGVMTISNHDKQVYYRAEHVELLMAIASQAAVAIENARLYRRSYQQARQLTTLNQIGRTITSWLEFDRIPSVIIDQVTTLLNVEEGSLLLTDEASGDLIFSYTIGPFGSKLLGQRLPRGTGIAGYVATSGQSVIVNDAQRDGRFDATTDRSTGYITRRLLAAPLRGVGGIVGVVEVLNRRDNSPFTDEDRRLLEALGDYAAIAIENARRFAQVDQQLARRAQELARINDQLQHNLRSLTALNALGMAVTATLRSPDEIYAMTTRGVVEMTGALAAWVFLPSSDGWRNIVTVGAALADDGALGPIMRRVLDTGRPELISAAIPEPLSRVGAQTMMIVPLRTPRATLGCLCVAYQDQPPDASDRETIALFATQAAGAVENLELLSAVRTARDQMGSILASTREGMLLIGPDGRVAMANARIQDLCGLTAEQVASGVDMNNVLFLWGEHSPGTGDEWSAFQHGLADVIARRGSFASGELNEQHGGRSIEWAALPALGSGDSHGGSLLVLRDITVNKEAEKLRQDLTHMIVHDLRSPLSSVIASVDMLLRGVTGELNASQEHVLSIAGDSSQQMLAMINTLLDISRLEAGRMPLNRQPLDICAMVQRTASQLSTLALERKITIDTVCDQAALEVVADPALLTRVVQNLIANAVKFSGRGATVSIRVRVSSDGGVRVSVHDQGIGIAPRDREKIFAKFGQVGERRGGSGLGLTFCKLVIEAHNGQIWVESELGEGSTFFFSLPKQ